MSEYRRIRIAGATYFFTLVTYKRSPFFKSKENIEILKRGIKHVQKKHHFKIDSICVLPDHIHLIMLLPENDKDYSVKIRLIKQYATMHINKQNLSKNLIWQPRFWEHTIRNDRDLELHRNYIHYNPVKHGYTMAPKDWEYSSFNSFVKKGFYEENWGLSEPKELINFDFE